MKNHSYSPLRCLPFKLTGRGSRQGRIPFYNDHQVNTGIRFQRCNRCRAKRACTYRWVCSLSFSIRDTKHTPQACHRDLRGVRREWKWSNLGDDSGLLWNSPFIDLIWQEITPVILFRTRYSPPELHTHAVYLFPLWALDPQQYPVGIGYTVFYLLALWCRYGGPHEGY